MEEVGKKGQTYLEGEMGQRMGIWMVRARVRCWARVKVTLRAVGTGLDLQNRRGDQLVRIRKHNKKRQRLPPTFVE